MELWPQDTFERSAWRRLTHVLMFWILPIEIL